jgi:hypothetical protein
VTAWQKLRAIFAGLTGRHDGLPCTREELEFRALIGMPALHPESIIRELPGRQEKGLAALANELWPDDEWAGIITEIRGTEGQL